MLPPALRRFVDMFNVVSGSQQITQACVSLREQWEMGNANGVFHISHGKISNPQAPFRPDSGLSESTDTGVKAWYRSPVECASV